MVYCCSRNRMEGVTVAYSKSVGGAALLFVAGLAVAFVVIFACQASLTRLSEATAFGTWPIAAQEAALILALFTALALVALAGARIAGRPIRLGRQPVRAGLAGWAAGAAGLFLAFALSLLAGVVVRPATATPLQPLLLLGGLALALFQTSVEELFFRGWMQPALIGGWGRWPGLIGTAAAFAALHLASGAQPVSLVTIFLAGLWFGLLAERAGGIALSIGAHFGWNGAEEFLLGITPNPGSGSFGSLLDFDFAGSSWWGGSAEALNASLSAICVLAALSLATIGWSNPVPRPRAPAAA